MKRALFISHSRLSHNLLQTVMPLVSKAAELSCVENIDEAVKMVRRGNPFQLVVVDWNCLKELSDWESEIAKLNQHRLFKEAGRILLHGHGTSLPEASLRDKGFAGFYTKPFLAEELAKVIDDHL